MNVEIVAIDLIQACPKCGVQIVHESAQALRSADEKEAVCRKCRAELSKSFDWLEEAVGGFR